MWASVKRVTVDENGIVHLVRVGSPDRSVCGTWFYKHTFFEQPTCVACIAHWTHPCGESCVMMNGCDGCDGRDWPER